MDRLLSATLLSALVAINRWVSSKIDGARWAILHQASAVEILVVARFRHGVDYVIGIAPVCIDQSNAHVGLIRVILSEVRYAAYPARP